MSTLTKSNNYSIEISANDARSSEFGTNFKNYSLTLVFFVYLYFSYHVSYQINELISLSQLNSIPLISTMLLSVSALIALLPVVLIEFITNYRRKKKLGVKHFVLKNAFFVYLSTAALLYFIQAETFLINWWGIKIPYHLFLHFTTYSYGTVIAVFLNTFLADLIIYFTHRALHQWAFLWRFHSVHHALTDLTIYSTVQHVFERILMFASHALVLAPIAIFYRPVPLFVTWYLVIHAAFIHAELKFLNYGILNIFLEAQHSIVLTIMLAKNIKIKISPFFSLLSTYFSVPM